MTLDALTSLLRVLAWPVVVLFAVLLLRHEIRALVGRVREIEALGGKISLDPDKVEQIIKKGLQENAPAAEVAQRIVQAATVLDKLETRILRALIDDDGRAIYNYQTDYYRRALESLIAKGYVKKEQKGFALTPEGRKITSEYLLNVLQSPDHTGVGPARK